MFNLGSFFLVYFLSLPRAKECLDDPIPSKNCILHNNDVRDVPRVSNDLSFCNENDDVCGWVLQVGILECVTVCVTECDGGEIERSRRESRGEPRSRMTSLTHDGIHSMSSARSFVPFHSIAFHSIQYSTVRLCHCPKDDVQPSDL